MAQLHFFLHPEHRITEIEVEIKRRDETTATRLLASGDRIVFTMNDRALGVANGVAGFICEIDMSGFEPVLSVELDDMNERGERLVRVPASFAYFDHAYCLTDIRRGQPVPLFNDPLRQQRAAWPGRSRIAQGWRLETKVPCRRYRLAGFTHAQEPGQGHVPRL